MKQLEKKGTVSHHNHSELLHHCSLQPPTEDVMTTPVMGLELKGKHQTKRMNITHVHFKSI